MHDSTLEFSRKCKQLPINTPSNADTEARRIGVTNNVINLPDDTQPYKEMRA